MNSALQLPGLMIMDLKGLKKSPLLKRKKSNAKDSGSVETLLLSNCSLSEEMVLGGQTDRMFQS